MSVCTHEQGGIQPQPPGNSNPEVTWKVLVKSNYGSKFVI